MLKRVVCFLLVLLMPCVALGEYTMAGYDDEATYRDWSANLFFQRMEEKTGVDFNYVQYKKEAEWTAAKAAMTVESDLPDVLFKAELTPDECARLLDNGVLLDLKELIPQYCPNLNAILEAHPDYWDAISLPDGRVAALPAISEQPLQNCVWLNQSWLNNLGLAMPTTVEELTDVLRAFRDKDPNLNAKRDEVPLAFIGPFDLKFLGHAFGLVANDYNIRAVDGKAEFVPLNENYRAFVEWLRLLYAEGLIAKDGFSTSDSLRAVSEAKEANVYGGAITTMVTNFLPTEWASQYAVMMPIAYNGEQTYRSFIGHVQNGTCAVTTACENVEEILGWIDLFYTEEVYVLTSAGLENVDYVVDGDNTWRMTELATNNMYFTGETLIASGTAAPGLASDAFQRRYHDKTVAFISEQMALINEVAERPFPYYGLTDAQNAQIDPLQRRIGRLVDETLARWVLGEVEISDESFAQFEKDLKDAGLDEFMTFWQSVLDGRN